MKAALKKLRRQYEQDMQKIAAIRWQLLCLKDEIYSLECKNKQLLIRAYEKVMEEFK